MKRHDKRTREQRKADESALFAAACLGATILLIVISILATSAQAVEAEPEETPIVEEYDPAWDIPATESAVCNDVFLGEFTITYYCACRMCCGKEESNPNYGITATGTLATEGRTVAVDPSVIPYGTEIRIIYPDGEQRTYISEDCGGAIKGNRIDVFMETHEKALKAGIKTAEVFICGGEKIQ
nr:MAG TPA: lytic transglycosylase [Caudoviricetes sp.]